MTRKTKVMAMVLVLMMAAGLLAGCGQQAAPAPIPEGELSAAVMLMDYEAKWDLIVEQAKREGKVTFYAYSEEPFFKEMADQFQAEYGISVEVIMGDQNAIFDKVAAEGNRPQGTVDAILMGGQNLGKMIDEGLFYGPFAEMVPNHKYLDTVAAYFTEGIAIRGMLVPFRRNQTGFVYNPEFVSNPPQTVAELERWIEANPGRFGYAPPNSGGSGQAFVTAMIYELTGGAAQYSGDYDESKTAAWSVVWDWLNKIEPNITYGNSNADILDKINQGEIWLAPNWEDMTFKYMEAGNLFQHAEIYIPEGIAMLGGSDDFAVIRNAPNKAAALVWINYLISESAQEQMNDMIGAKPARQNVVAEKNLISDAEISAKGSTWFNGDYKTYMINTWIEEVGRQ